LRNIPLPATADRTAVDERCVTTFFRFDINRDGMISFQEFAQALSVMTRGTPDEKLESK
jgi:Ca2+-binding EF-hand superfamily protein